VLIVALIVGAGLVAWRLRDVLALAFGSVLLAIGFRTLADAAKRWLRAPEPLALLLAVLTVAGVLVLAVWTAEATVAGQFRELARKLPESLLAVESRIDALPFGAALTAQLHGAAASTAAGSPRLIAAVVASAASLLGLGAIAFFGAVFMAVDPARYRRGLLALVPPGRRAHYADVLGRLSVSLRRWLAGKLATMGVSGLLTSLGLWALGVDAPFAIGLTGAILCFVPNVGSVVATAIAMLIAYLREPVLALYVALLYWAVHFLEGISFGPMIQDTAVRIAPVFSIFAILVFAVLLGAPGVLLSGPLMVVAVVLVQTLYIEDVLGEHVTDEPRPARRPWPWPRRPVAD
jgi:predicted PurR-regulated permease PerM